MHGFRKGSIIKIGILVCTMLEKKYILKIGLTTGYGTLSSCNSDSLRFLFCTVFLKYTKNL